MEQLTKQEKAVLMNLINKKLTTMEKHGWDFSNLDYMTLRDIRNKLKKAKAKNPKV